MTGIIDQHGRNIHVLRISRNGDVNDISELSPDFVSDISKDPLVRHSGVFEGIFYKHVILCESETDSQFYGAILDIAAVHGDTRPDALFVHASGKNRIAKLTRITSQLGVPRSAIVDIDILSDKALFKSITDEFGIIWTQIEPLWKVVTETINAQRSKLSPAQLISAIEISFEQLKNGEIKLAQFFSSVKELSSSNSPWLVIKRAGRNGLPPGEVVEKFDQLLERCGQNGLWIVPVGELEGFCRSVTAKKGSAWIAQLLETKDLEQSLELEEARRFVGTMWSTAIKS